MELKSLKLLELKALAKSKGIHDAYKYNKAEEMMESEMKKVTGGVNIPGLI
jgi:DNA-binding protein YbaB